MYRREVVSLAVCLAFFSLFLTVAGSDLLAGPSVRLSVLQFDPGKQGEPTLWPEYRAVHRFGQQGYFIVQFDGPITRETRDALCSRGASIIWYIPEFAFLVRMDSDEALALVEDDSLPVRWVGPYQPAYKLSPELCRFVCSGPEAINEDFPALLVQFFPSDRSVRPLSEFVRAVRGCGARVEVLGVSPRPQRPRAVIGVAIEDLGQLLPEIAGRPEVDWIALYHVPRVANDLARWVCQSGVSNQCPIWDRGIHGEGQIIGVGDTGVDADSCFFYDISQGLPDSTVNTWQRKIIAYYDWTGGGGWDEDGHGTHVAGTLAGDNFANSEGYDTNDGIAYRAKLVVQDVGRKEDLSSIPFGLAGYFQQAYDAGARIHSNSWGESWESGFDHSYNYHSQDVDEYMWRHRDFLIFFANGNDGPAKDTVSAPATAKDCVSVGACENPYSGLSEDNVAESSSHGPTRDGRIKPTIVAPGYYLVSADSDGNISSFNCGTRVMAGTSMACPAAAASAALVRQYFTEGFYPSGARNPADAFQPSASLIKAVLINGAAVMSGSHTGGPIPSWGQGWGRIDLDNVLFFRGERRGLVVWDISPGLYTGRSDEYTVYASPAEPLRITLVWTDYPSSSAAQTNLVNDLDLVVISPAQTHYRGNNFSNGLSQPGGQADRLNVVECVYIESPEDGEYVIRVEGYNIPYGPQPYSIVVSGGQESSAKAPTLSGGSVAPPAGSTSTTFTFSVHYEHPEAKAPSVMNVVVDETPCTMSLASGSAADGDYEFKTRLSKGTHQYYFYFEDPDGLSARLPKEGHFSGPTVGGTNITPVLSDGTVWPTVGKPTTTFSYSVSYYDANADPPAAIEVIIDGVIHSMSLTDGVDYDGLYTYQTNLPLGSHSFYFYCNDGSGGDDRFPASGTISGPDVVSGNVPPCLSDAKVTPESGTTETQFVFSVHYYDADGDAPATGVAIVDDEAHGMSLQTGTDSDGVYIYAAKLGVGSHSYAFFFCDPSGGYARDPESGNYSGPDVAAANTPPVLSDGSVSPDTGGKQTQFVFSVHYYDADGDAPATGVVYIDSAAFEMQLYQGDADNGRYRYSTTLALGTHSYYFLFGDGRGGVGRDPLSGAYEGPTVRKTDPELSVSLILNGETYHQGDRHIVWITCKNTGAGVSADLYVALMLPSGTLLYYPSFSEVPTALLASFWWYSDFEVISYELLSEVLPLLAEGQYIWYAAYTKPGTMEFMADIASAEWFYSTTTAVP